MEQSLFCTFSTLNTSLRLAVTQAGYSCLNQNRRSDTIDRIFKRGDIYYAELNPVIGSQQGGTRPVLIISNDTGNRHSPTVIIAAITGKTQTKAKLPTHAEVKDVEGLDRDSIILLEQIRTIDKRRLKNHMGTMPDNIMARVDVVSFQLSSYTQGFDV